MYNASSPVKELQLEPLIFSLQHLLPLLGIVRSCEMRVFSTTHGKVQPPPVIYTLEDPQVFQCGVVGGPRLCMSEDVLLNLRLFGFT